MLFGLEKKKTVARVEQRIFFWSRNTKMQNSRSSSSTGEGNTKPPPKQIAPAKKWCFTYNNPIEDWKTVLVPKFQEIGDYIIGEEICPSTGTPHLQGFIETKQKVRPKSLGLPAEIHWEKCRGTRADNIMYCSKDNLVSTNIKLPRALPEIHLWGWQLNVQEQFGLEANSRDINWVWSLEGARGKSTMVRWMAMQGALVCSGKAADMKFLILKYHEKNGVYPDVVVFDVPRSMINYISYQGLEEIKNGVFCSTKYECDMVIMHHPQVWVFANVPPDMTDRHMSSDRWKVLQVDNDETMLEAVPVMNANNYYYED